MEVRCGHLHTQRKKVSKLQTIGEELQAGRNEKRSDTQESGKS